MTATTLKNNQFQIILTALVIVLIAIAFLPGALDTLAQSATCQDKVSDPDAGFLYIRCRGATIFYGEGTCEGNCAGKPNLPIDAKEALDALDVLVPASFVYFRLVDSEKNPTNGWTTICFDVNTIDDVRDPRVRYYNPHINSWIPIYHRFDADTGAMCTDFAGEFSMAVLGFAK